MWDLDKAHPDRISEDDLDVFAIRQGAQADRPRERPEDYDYSARLVIGQSERGYHYTVHDADSRLEGEHTWVWSRAYDTEAAAEAASRADTETSWMPLPEPRELGPQPDRRGRGDTIGVSAKGYHYCLHSTDYEDPDFLAGQRIYSAEAYGSVAEAAKASLQWTENLAALEKARLKDDCRRALSAADPRAPQYVGQEEWDRRARKRQDTIDAYVAGEQRTLDEAENQRKPDVRAETRPVRNFSDAERSLLERIASNDAIMEALGRLSSDERSHPASVSAASKGTASDHVDAMFAVERRGKSLKSEPASEEKGNLALSAMRSSRRSDEPEASPAPRR